MDDAFFQHYLALDLSPGCTWAQVKSSYRHLVKTWHPDRYHQDHTQRLQAEERIKEINHAYRALEDYFKKHGELPVPVVRIAEEPAGPHEPETAPDAGRHTGTTAAASAPVDNEPGTARKGKHTGFMRFLVVFGIAWGCYLLWNWQPEQTGSADESRSSGHLEYPEYSGLPGKDDTGDHEKKYFTFGSTLGEVHAIQGIPTATTEGVWYYGKSKVYFDQGHVTHWENDPSSPLNVSLDTTLDDSRITGIDIGRTKAEVRSIQGKPLIEHENEWDYGASKIYFRNGRVSGWYSSEFSPLKIEK
jgi:hypothetical protein